jgi:methionyl-tRNA formyltransferase
MPYKSVLIISDNERISTELATILGEQPRLEGRTIRFGCHPDNKALVGKRVGGYVFEKIDLKHQLAEIIQSCDLVISAHCKQIFPEALVRACKCINVHPGHNPHNRGWYPQVFSILNGLPFGATIHEIDEQLDHGHIIDRETLGIESSDSSLTAYNKVLDLEVLLLRRSLPAILSGTYRSFAPEEEGNLNLKRDFNALREIRLDEVLTFGEAILRLRALSHPPFKNAFYVDPQTGDRVWVTLELESEAKGSAAPEPQL